MNLQQRTTYFTTDPFAQDFSPYSGMSNNPVAMVDPTGGIYSWAEEMCSQWIDESRILTRYSHYGRNSWGDYAPYSPFGEAICFGSSGGGSGCGSILSPFSDTYTSFDNAIWVLMSEASKKWLKRREERLAAETAEEQSETIVTGQFYYDGQVLYGSDDPNIQIINVLSGFEISAPQSDVGRKDGFWENRGLYINAAQATSSMFINARLTIDKLHVDALFDSYAYNNNINNLRDGLAKSNKFLNNARAFSSGLSNGFFYFSIGTEAIDAFNDLSNSNYNEAGVHAVNMGVIYGCFPLGLWGIPVYAAYSLIMQGPQSTLPGHQYFNFNPQDNVSVKPPIFY